jgi:hypothetical protein
MKAWRGLWVACVGLIGLRLAAAESLPVPKLTGIVQVDGNNLALLELRSATGPQIMMPMMGVGDRADGWSVTAIDEASATATVRRDLRQWVLSLPQSDQVPKRVLNLREASFKHLLAVYQQLSGMTVLREDTLPEVRIDLATGANVQSREVVALINEALDARGVIAKPRQDRYVFVVRRESSGVLQPIRDPPAASENPDDTVFPPGMLSLTEADVPSVFQIYQELSGRTLLRSNGLAAGKSTVRNQAALNRAEAVWLLETVLRLGGVRIVAEGERFAFAVPASFPPDKALPKFDTEAVLAKIREVHRPAAPLRFVDVASEELLARYADLVGRERQPVLQSLSQLTFSLYSPGDLTQCEAIYALEALAALSDCQFEITGGSVRLRPGPGVKRPAPPGNLRVTVR